MTNGYESKFIDTISKEIFYKLCHGPLHVGENLVGLYARAEKMDVLQFVGSDKVRMIGICGIGGIGKTTMAKAIYNLLYIRFDGCSFCEDVKGVVEQHGLVHLQTKLLDDITKVMDLKIHNVSEGIGIMKRRMGTRKALIVLDDVDHDNQFEALAAKHWLAPGSMIVVTSRDRQLLNAHGVEEIYEGTTLVKGLALDISSSEVNICGKTFTKLNNLRLLNLYGKGGNEIKERMDPFMTIDIILPVNNIPRWFSIQSIGDSIKVELPPHWCYEKFKRLDLCALVTLINPAVQAKYFRINSVITNFDGAPISNRQYHPYPGRCLESDQLWLSSMSFGHGWKKAKNYIVVSVQVKDIYWNVKRCGARLVCEEDEEKEAMVPY